MIRLQSEPSELANINKYMWFLAVLTPHSYTLSLCVCVCVSLSLCLSLSLVVVTKDGVFVLDMAAKIDATADYLCKAKWGDVEFPPPFGREAYPEVRAATGSTPLLETSQSSVC